MRQMFHPFQIQHGLLREEGDVRAWGVTGDSFRFSSGSTYFGMITEGRAQLHYQGDIFPLRAGMFFVASEGALHGGRGLLIEARGYRGVFQIGGPLEATGRLRYIDGCTDTLLVSPPRLGEPCLNHLHLPKHTTQSPHTHPSIRVGVIASGSGECVTKEKRYPLQPGLAWWIPAGVVHSFDTNDEALNVIAWHPDSDYGPTDENHPMLNKTIRQSARREDV
jgi:mannose-6-phosphate isomerase-like protein (cupin superfamily)